jgi:hypothetical protein
MCERFEQLGVTSFRAVYAAVRRAAVLVMV